MLPKPRQLEALQQFIRKLQCQKFYGSVELKLQAGDIVHCLKKESIKLDAEQEAPTPSSQD